MKYRANKTLSQRVTDTKTAKTLTEGPKFLKKRVHRVRRLPGLLQDRTHALDEEGPDLVGGDLVDVALAGGGDLRVAGVVDPEENI